MNVRLGVACVILTVAAAAPAAAFPLYCRGPLPMISSSPGAVEYSFQKAPAAAGDGASLQPGQCAWADRPLSAAEPNVVHFQRDLLLDSGGEPVTMTKLQQVYFSMVMKQVSLSRLERTEAYLSASNFVTAMPAYAIPAGGVLSHPVLMTSPADKATPVN